MLTRADQTVEDCLEVFEQVCDTGLRHVGFKDIGADRPTLKELNRRIKDSGATSYLEVVSESEAACLNSARAAIDIGVDRVMGGTQAEAILEILNGSGIEYFPFPGKPLGHPTELGGSAQDIAAHCRHFEEIGCSGVDLLAYRATDADPLDLVRAARGATQGWLVVDGSVNSPARIHELSKASADAFTSGSAAFDGSFSPRQGALNSQIHDIMAACA